MKLNYPNCLIGVVLCFSFLSYAQVGVNTTNPQAQLDVVASNPTLPSNTDGFLVPRIDVFPVTNPTASQQGMLVYLTTAVGINPPGFYFWDNTTVTWKPIAATSASNDWSLTGNSGTTSGTNFIGTTDNVALTFRVNNVRSGLISNASSSSTFFGYQSGGTSSSNGNSGFGHQSLSALTIGTNNTANGYQSLNANTTGINNTAFGYRSLASNVTGTQNVAIGNQALVFNTGNNNVAVGSTTMFSNTTGNNNVSLGNNSMYSNISGGQNAVVGFEALMNNTSGGNNVAIGFRALQSNSTSFNNNAVGSSSLQNNTGLANNAFGTGSLFTNVSGASNVALGHQAGYLSTGNRNIYVGYQAGYNETGSDKLYIDNSNTTSPLIYGDFATNLLKINGTLNVNNAYNLPTTSGATNQLLQTDGAGNTTWVNAPTLTEIDPQVSSTTTNYIPKWNGSTLVDGLVFDNGTNIGIGTTTPSSRFHISSNNTATNTTIESGNLQYPTALSILPSSHAFSKRAIIKLDDWHLLQDLTGTGTKDFALYQNSTGQQRLTIGTSGNVGVGINNPTEKLEVNGKTKTTNIQVTNGAANGYVLQSDATGNGTWVNPSSLTVTETDPQVSSTSTNRVPKWNGTSLVDGQVFDNGTNIGVGTVTPTDKIHIVGNVKIDGGKLPFVNTGQSVFIGENAGLNDDLTANQNVFIGWESGKLNTSGNLNTFIGHGSGMVNNTGSANSALGQFALGSTTTGSNNTAVGRAAISRSTSGTFNTAIGYSALENNTIGNYNVSIGDSSLGSNLTGNFNTALGSGAGYNNNGSYNVFLGVDAGFNETGSNKLYIDNTNTNNPLIYGDFTTNLLKINGTLNVNNAYNLPTTSGTANQILQTDGAGNTTWVDSSTLTVTEIDPQVSSTIANYVPKWNGTTLVDGQVFDNGTNVGVGTVTPTDKVHVVGNVKIDGGRLPFVNTGQSVFIGDNAGVNDDLTTNQNVFVGHFSGNQNSTGIRNTAYGAFAFDSNTTGSFNTAIGYSSLSSNTTGTSNIAVGESSLNSSTSSTGSIAIGTSSLKLATTANNNVAIGNSVLSNATSVSNTIALGVNALGNTASTSTSVAIGAESGRNNITGTGNIFLGYQSGLNETGSNKLYIENSNSTTPLIYGDFATNLLKVNGTLNVNNAYNLPLTSGTTNQVLQSDGAGNTAWVSSTTLTITESDPQVSSSTTNFVPRWNGTSLVDGTIYNNGIEVGIGTALPNSLLTIGGPLTSTGIGQIMSINVSNDEPLLIAADNAKGVTMRSYADAFGIQGRSGTNFATYDNLTLNQFGGNVGIGTATPTQAKLVVQGFDTNTFANYGFLNRTTPTGIVNPAVAQNYSIYASHRIAASEFNAYSDARIKNIKGISNGKLDLETLSKIEITNYTLKDSISKGNNNYKKVIAQQVEKVYPQAVSKLTDVVPDIYQQADMINGFIELENNLKSGEKVKIITQSDEQMVEVLEANSKGFKIDSNQTEKIFVYGRQVNDFRSVDYEALSTLNISATQELLKRIELLESENASLKVEISKNEAINNNQSVAIQQLIDELSAIKKQLKSEEPILLTKN